MIKLLTFCMGISIICNVSFADSCPQVVQKNLTVNRVIQRKVLGFTEGLLFHDHNLIESVGNAEGRAGINKIDPTTGSVKRLATVLNDPFAEGIAFFKDQFFQLTYTEGKVFIYDANFQNVQTATNPLSQGWGLTTDGTNLIGSDGSKNISFIDPEHLTIQKSIVAHDNVRWYPDINELEYVNGEIYANIWLQKYVIGIQPATGCVDQIIDLNPLYKFFTQDELQNISSDPNAVPNGIAYDPDTQHFYFTGKMWPKIFESTLD